MIETFEEKLKNQGNKFTVQYALANKSDYQDENIEELQKRIAAIGDVVENLKEILKYYQKERDEIMGNDKVNHTAQFSMQKLRQIRQPIVEQEKELKIIRDERQKVAKEIDKLEKRKKIMQIKLQKEEQDKLKQENQDENEINENSQDPLANELECLKQVNKESVRKEMNRHCRKQILDRMLQQSRSKNSGESEKSSNSQDSSYIQDVLVGIGEENFRDTGNTYNFTKLLKKLYQKRSTSPSKGI